MIDQTTAELMPLVGTQGADQAVGRARATYYRHRTPAEARLALTPEQAA
jgi:hypothetical protein